MRTRIKICGVTSPKEAALVVEAGADALGLIFAPSPRRVSFEQAREILADVPTFVARVAVFVDPSSYEVEAALRLGCVPQFCGEEQPEFCDGVTPGPYLKVFHVDTGGEANASVAVERFAVRYPRAGLLFDARVDGRRGGTGTTFDWGVVREIALRRKIVVSAGLRPENVGGCIRQVRPYAVDVRSGVETNAHKDPARIAAFVRAVREADAET